MLNSEHFNNVENVVMSDVNSHYSLTSATKSITHCRDSTHYIRGNTFFNDWWNDESNESFLELERLCGADDWAAQKWHSILEKKFTILNDEEEPSDTSSARKTARRLSFSDASDNEDDTFVNFNHINRNEEGSLPARLRPSIYNVFPAQKRINFFESPNLHPSTRCNDGNKENVTGFKERFASVSVRNESNSNDIQDQIVCEFNDTLDAVNYFIERGNRMMTAKSTSIKNSNKRYSNDGKNSQNNSLVQRTLGRRQLECWMNNKPP